MRTGGIFHDSASLIGGRHQWYDSNSDWRRNDRGTVNVDEVLGAGERYYAEMAYVKHGPQTAAQQLAFRCIDEQLKSSPHWRTLEADHGVVNQYIQRFMEGARRGWDQPKKVEEGYRISGYGQEIRNTIGREVTRLIRVYADSQARLQDAAVQQRLANIESHQATIMSRPPGIAELAAAARAEQPAQGGSVSGEATVRLVSREPLPLQFLVLHLK